MEMIIRFDAYGNTPFHTAPMHHSGATARPGAPSIKGCTNMGKQITSNFLSNWRAPANWNGCK
jgi:hypothetical protein